MTTKERQPGDLLTPCELAEYLNTNERKLRYLRSTGKGPRWTRVGREIRYGWADIQRYLIERARR
ncbi:MAG: helix-turn-helix domain-containing protein [Pseudoclavibacter sp.]